MKKYSRPSKISTKASMLRFLQSKLKFSKIEKIYTFTVLDWSQNKNQILKNIKNEFSSNIVIRSSAIGEDSIKKSHAGEFLSILNINPENYTLVKSSITKIIQSYTKKDSRNLKNEILIQTYSKNILYSGVILSHVLQTGSPYYVINYDESNITDSVTKGLINNSFKIFRNTKKNLIPNPWKKLIKSVTEIEKLLNSTSLDIEFGINSNNEIIIFQVRPITSGTLVCEKIIEKLLNKNIKKLKKEFLINQDSNKKTIFSDMADWNPAEIIGNRPNNLDYSIYDYLIMSSSWHKGRTHMGYKKLKNQNLMVKFADKPYVNTVRSFNSLIPNKINKNISKKMNNFYLQKLNKYPHLHDKIEFEIIFSCYEPLIKNRLNELKQFKFTTDEINYIEKILIDFTNRIINNFSVYLNDSLNSIATMQNNRKKILANLRKNNLTYREFLIGAESLLIDCKKFGTKNFSTMARISFIGSIILKSLVQSKKIEQNTYESFMNSLESPLSDFQKDIENIRNKKISRSTFLKKYGHLRPGTYDITANRYDKDPIFIKEIERLNFIKHKTKEANKTEINNSILKSSLNFKNIDFFTFLKKSITHREELKFEFTKNLSDAIELISIAGGKLNFSRDDLSYLELKTIFNYSERYDELKLKTKLGKKILNEKKIKRINQLIHLPPILTSESDFYFIKYHESKPNFITQKNISSEIQFLGSSHNNKIDNRINNKIVIIENADPGYDWIFSYNISGLITKYGGVASHMAIRCSELNLPASIGCGEIIFEKLLHASKINLDCAHGQITVLDATKYDKYDEEKRLLKSLGYIK